MNTSTPSLTLAQMVSHMTTIVQHIAEHADEVLLAMPPRQRAALVNQFGQLVEQAAFDEMDWLSIVTRLHQWITGIPETGIWTQERLSQLEHIENFLSHQPPFSTDKAPKSYLQPSLQLCYQTLLLALKKWRWFGAFKNDPQLDFIYDDIERQRDLHRVGGSH